MMSVYSQARLRIFSNISLEMDGENSMISKPRRNSLYYVLRYQAYFAHGGVNKSCLFLILEVQFMIFK